MANLTRACISASLVERFVAFTYFSQWNWNWNCGKRVGRPQIVINQQFNNHVVSGRVRTVFDGAVEDHRVGILGTFLNLSQRAIDWVAV